MKYFQDHGTFIIEKKNPPSHSDEGISIDLIESSPKEFYGGSEFANGHETITYTTKKEKLSFGNVSGIRYTTFANENIYYITVNEFQGIKNPKWDGHAGISFMGIQDDRYKEENIKINDQIVSALRFFP